MGKTGGAKKTLWEILPNGFGVWFCGILGLNFPKNLTLKFLGGVLAGILTLFQLWFWGPIFFRFSGTPGRLVGYFFGGPPSVLFGASFFKKTLIKIKGFWGGKPFFFLPRVVFSLFKNNLKIFKKGF